MITLDYFELALASIGILALQWIYGQFKIFLHYRKVTGKMKAEYEESNKNACKTHSWVKMTTDLFGEASICEECGKVAQQEAFIPMEAVKAYQKQVEISEKFIKFKEDTLKSLANDYELTFENTEMLYNDMCMLYTNFINKQLMTETESILSVMSEPDIPKKENKNES